MPRVLLVCVSARAHTGSWGGVGSPLTRLLRLLRGRRHNRKQFGARSLAGGFGVLEEIQGSFLSARKSSFWLCLACMPTAAPSAAPSARDGGGGGGQSQARGAASGGPGPVTLAVMRGRIHVTAPGGVKRRRRAAAPETAVAQPPPRPPPLPLLPRGALGAGARMPVAPLSACAQQLVANSGGGDQVCLRPGLSGVCPAWWFAGF